MSVPRKRIDPTTAFELTAEIERQIAAGELGPGDRLTPVRTAARELGLAPNTVSTAYRRLGDRGLVVGEGRRGTFVSDRPATAHRADQPVAADLVDLATGNPDATLLPDLGSAIARIATDHIAYGHPPIDPGLAAALRADLQPDIGPLVPDGIEAGRSLAVVGGALDGIERTLDAHLRPGDRVAVEDPAYASVLNLVAAMNLRAEPLRIDRFGMMPEELDRSLAGGCRAVIVTPRAQNPTGAALDASRAAALSGVLADHPEVLIIEDDHAGPVAGASYATTIPPGFEQWAVIRSVAKSLGPDLRLAALIGDERTVNRVVGRQLLGTGWVSHILQRTVAELLTAGETPTLFRTASDRYRQRRTAFIDRLAEHGIEATGRSGLNVWVPVADEAQVVADMQHRGFAIRSGSRYRKRSAPAVRISTAAAEIEVLHAAADTMASVMGGGPQARSV